MARQGDISVRMTADLQQAAQQLVTQKQIQQDLADALGLTRSEVNKLQREINRKQRAEQAATATTTKAAVAQTTMARASTASTAATNAATAAMARMGIVANGALGPIGLVVGALAALGAGSLGAANRMSGLVDEAANLAEATGLSQRQVLALQHAVGATGGDINKTKEALASFTRVMSHDLAGKSGPQVDAVLRQTVARIEAIESPAERAAERMRIFGTESARALAPLTSGALERGAERTAGLAEAMDRAAGSSAEMDRTNADLSRALDELTVVLGDKLAPNVVVVTDALTNMVDATTLVTDASGALLSVLTPPGLAGMLWRYADGARESARETSKMAMNMGEAESAAKKLRDETAMAADIDRAFTFEFETRETPKESPDQKKARENRIEAAEAEQAEIERARKAVREQFARDDFQFELERNEERARQIAQGAQLMAEIENEDAMRREQLHQEEMRRLSEQAQGQQMLMGLRADALLATTSGLSEVVAASSESAEALAAARVLETIAYGAVAFSRALAEFGPIAGLPIAISTAAQVAAQVAAVKSAPSRHMGGVAPDEGVVRVRNNERVTFEPATTRRGQQGQAQTAILTVDNQAFRAMQRRSGRQDTIFGDRRRRAVEV